MAEFPSVCTSHIPSPTANQDLRPTIRDFVCAINRAWATAAGAGAKTNRAQLWREILCSLEPAVERQCIEVGRGWGLSESHRTGKVSVVWTTVILESISLMGQLVVHTITPEQNTLLRARGCSHLLFSLYKEALTLPQTSEFHPEAFRAQTLRPNPDLCNPSLQLKFFLMHMKA